MARPKKIKVPNLPKVEFPREPLNITDRIPAQDLGLGILTPSYVEYMFNHLSREQFWHIYAGLRYRLPTKYLQN